MNHTTFTNSFDACVGHRMFTTAYKGVGIDTGTKAPHKHYFTLGGKDRSDYTDGKTYDSEAAALDAAKKAIDAGK